MVKLLRHKLLASHILRWEFGGIEGVELLLNNQPTILPHVEHSNIQTKK
jgi:hypothetical protein